MTEYRFYPAGTVPEVSTSDWHRDRARVPHLEQSPHVDRLDRALLFVKEAARQTDDATVSDLGAGDGGFLSLVKQIPYVHDAWGYDFTPANVAGSVERDVVVYYKNFLEDDVVVGTIVVMTEVLEHLDDPHGVLASLYRQTADTRTFLVISSPSGETPESHDECHVWGWDVDGYAALVTGAGWTVSRHEIVGNFQVVLAHNSITQPAG